ncbi:MAG: YegS/Rv2252/BmrU family lipid kinase [Bacteroidota bacterium]|nr:YegS/Rv2252/BmrU family lipid kinase [Bacteroidota bacterium]
MKRHILYIINPISGTKSKGSLQQLIEHKTKAAGFEYMVHSSIAGNDYSFLYDIVLEKKITDVVIAGGDGTINGVVNAFKNLDVQFGILPFGSGNGLALTAGIPKNISSALQIIFNGKSDLTDAFLVNNHFACMLCGLGFDAQVAHDFANDPNRGLMTYIKQSVKNFFTATPYPFKIKIANEEFETEAFFISIANSNQFGNNVTIAPKASITDGLLDIVIVTKQNKFSVLLQTMRQVGGYNTLIEKEIANSNASIIYFQTEALQIKNISLAPMHIDGDPVEAMKHLNIEVLHKSFRLIQ